VKRPATHLEIGKLRRRTDFSSKVEGVAVELKHHAKLCVADADRVLQHALEYWLQFAGRRTDDLQYLRSRRLLL